MVDDHLPYAWSLEDLRVYQSALRVCEEIFEMTMSFPSEERYSLTDQIRRSSRSIGAQIAEAWGKRRYERHFISKITDANAERLETLHWLRVARHCGYIEECEANALLDRLDSIGKMLHSMTRQASRFCKPQGESVRSKQ